jgi:hypothetical protein
MASSLSRFIQAAPRKNRRRRNVPSELASSTNSCSSLATPRQSSCAKSPRRASPATPSSIAAVTDARRSIWLM